MSFGMFESEGKNINVMTVALHIHGSLNPSGLDSRNHVSKWKSLGQTALCFCVLYYTPNNSSYKKKKKQKLKVDDKHKSSKWSQVIIFY